MKTIRFKAKNINVRLKKMASNPFLVFCCLLLVSAAISICFFLYCEAVLSGAGAAEGGSVLQVKEFDSSAAVNVFNIWQAREQDYRNADSISYPDLFQDVAID